MGLADQAGSTATTPSTSPEQIGYVSTFVLATVDKRILDVKVSELSVIQLCLESTESTPNRKKNIV